MTSHGHSRGSEVKSGGAPFDGGSFFPGSFGVAPSHEFDSADSTWKQSLARYQVYGPLYELSLAREEQKKKQNPTDKEKTEGQRQKQRLAEKRKERERKRTEREQRQAEKESRKRGRLGRFVRRALGRSTRKAEEDDHVYDKTAADDNAAATDD